MNKQRKTYILLVAVIIIWSIVGFQFLGYVDSENELPEEIPYEKFVPKEAKEKELYTVSTHERDPFLDKYSRPKKVIRRKEVVPKEPIIFPSILFKGIIKNGDKKLFIIEVDGVQQVFKINKVINEVQVISGTSKKIEIKYKGEIQTFYR
ncbi:hypothetical protein BTO06_01270 [Tenacibaculum sp. SZ-18]|uniref:hypothetical protein n=1 Tax=Tenacibaculum sp. SZ-18 TaxID=754423 RepID=UPI000C2D655D|nr:hypothetical protein [Tenacibaculum sp. SZ-18]AUC13864.1 hypothetical protein BTO06_01270 [Tenacibaculum sp. SZ-18]